MTSGSSRLDWEYVTRRRFNLTTCVVFVLFGLLALFLATFVWMAATGDSFDRSLYWSLQTATTVGYGMGFAEWGTTEFYLCVVWMIVSVIYWACFVGVTVARIAEFFDR